LSSVCEEFYLVDSGQVQPFGGDLEDYRQWLSNSEASRDAEQSEVSASPKVSVDRKQQKRREAEFRQSVAPLKKRIQQAEQQIDTCNQQLESLQQALAEPSLYDDLNKEKLKRLLAEEKDCKQSLTEIEEQWMNDLEALELAQSEFEQAIE
jgi:ATP-binding cassette subfamily F protein 3